ncbi:hypothetical protein [Variovorax sp. GT1P44]|uniref:hypothetical protein n=1 Tax=Variovorax sp. GT1P44 TaxID=3443742 RepID=UPI003F489AEE
MLRISAWVISTAAAASLWGCAIAELKSDINATQGRVDAKQNILTSEEQTQAELTRQSAQLRMDLQSRQFSASQLKAKLDQMSKVNDSAPAATPQDRQRKSERARRLADSTRQAQALEQDTSLSQQEKARRLEELKAKTSNMLDILLKG